MINELDMEVFVYYRALDITESIDTYQEELLFQEVWLPWAALYKDRMYIVDDIT